MSKPTREKRFLEGHVDYVVGRLGSPVRSFGRVVREFFLVAQLPDSALCERPLLFRRDDTVVNSDSREPRPQAAEESALFDRPILQSFSSDRVLQKGRLTPFRFAIVRRCSRKKFITTQVGGNPICVSFQCSSDRILWSSQDGEYCWRYVSHASSIFRWPSSVVAERES